MRIGNVSPRINGLRLGYLGATANVSGLVSSYFSSFMNTLQFDLEQGTAATPATVQETLTNAVKTACADNSYFDPTAVCPDMSSVIAADVAQYTTAYNNGKAALAANVAAGLIATPLPASSYVAPAPAPAPTTAQVQYSSQPSNALDRVTPQTSTVSRGPGPVSSALAPPTTPAPVLSTNAGTFTGADATAKPAGSTSSGTGLATVTWLLEPTIISGIPNWIILAGAGVGLFVMMKGKGK